MVDKSKYVGYKKECFEEMTLQALQQGPAKEAGITGRWDMNKVDLVEKLVEHFTVEEDETPEVEAEVETKADETSEPVVAEVEAADESTEKEVVDEAAAENTDDEVVNDGETSDEDNGETDVEVEDSQASEEELGNEAKYNTAPRPTTSSENDVEAGETSEDEAPEIEGAILEENLVQDTEEAHEQALGEEFERNVDVKFKLKGHMDPGKMAVHIHFNPPPEGKKMKLKIKVSVKMEDED